MAPHGTRFCKPNKKGLINILGETKTIVVVAGVPVIPERRVANAIMIADATATYLFRKRYFFHLSIISSPLAPP